MNDPDLMHWDRICIRYILDQHSSFLPLVDDHLFISFINKSILSIAENYLFASFRQNLIHSSRLQSDVASFRHVNPPYHFRQRDRRSVLGFLPVQDYRVHAD